MLLLGKFIDRLPEGQLNTWFGAFAILAVFLLPLMTGVCGLVAWRLGDRITTLKEKSSKKIIDELTGSVAKARFERDEAYQEADSAKASAARTEAKHAPWTLSTTQKETFLNVLKGAPKGKVSVGYIRADEHRSRDFALRVKDLLKTAGYDLWTYMPVMEQAEGPSLVGVLIETKSESSKAVGESLQRAFKSIGIEAVKDHHEATTAGDDFVVIWIGLKP